MFLTFYGAAGIVTGSCFLIDTGHCRIMVDCGMFQGPKELRQLNYQPFPFPPRSIDFLLLTHAHIDHSGLIPKLVKHGFRGRIIATACTADLCGALLPDSGHIQEMEVERKNRKAKRSGRPLLEPIYTVDDAYESLKYFEKVDYGEEITLCDDITVKFQDAGHILGSALIELWVRANRTHTKFVFSGDLGNHGRPFVEDPSYVWEADCLVMESTYGNRLHPPNPTDNKELLKNAICRTYEKGGNVIIPAFAVERTQHLLYDLYLLRREGHLPPMDIYIDSPLATAVTKIFAKHQDCYDAEARALIEAGEHPLEMPELKYSLTVEDSRRLNEVTGGQIIIAGSGMCDAGRIRHHLKHNLWRPESTIIFVGYQAQGTLGRRILEGEKMVRLFGEDIIVRADIVNIEGFSAHADQNMLAEWVKEFHVVPQQLYLVHGEIEAAQELKNVLARKVGVSAHIPRLQETVAVKPGRGYREKLRQVSSSLLTRLEEFLNRKPDQDSYLEVLDKVVALEEYLEDKIKDGGSFGT
ncbi:MAG: MBL fold metallo-hydrolase [Peptococcaceae bacterium]|nr:MBL fold metallo-hydrolase [Peptococcaceae bacterium]